MTDEDEEGYTIDPRNMTPEEEARLEKHMATGMMLKVNLTNAQRDDRVLIHGLTRLGTAILNHVELAVLPFTLHGKEVSMLCALLADGSATAITPLFDGSNARDYLAPDGTKAYQPKDERTYN